MKKKKSLTKVYLVGFGTVPKRIEIKNGWVKIYRTISEIDRQEFGTCHYSSGNESQPGSLG